MVGGVIGGALVLATVAIITNLLLKIMCNIAGSPVTGTRRGTGRRTFHSILSSTRAFRSSARFSTSTTSTLLGRGKCASSSVSRITRKGSTSNRAINCIMGIASRRKCNKSVSVSMNVERSKAMANVRVLDVDRATNLKVGTGRTSFGSRFGSGGMRGFACAGAKRSKSSVVSTVDNTAVAAGTIAGTMSSTLMCFRGRLKNKDGRWVCEATMWQPYGEGSSLHSCT